MSTFDGTVSVITQKRKEQEVVTDKLASKTFAIWASHQLRQKGYPKVDDMVEGIRDGVSLIYLAEALCDTKVTHKYNTNPSTDIQKIENVAIALELLKSHGAHININSKDICDGNRKLVLGFVWRLIMHHQMLRPGESASDKNKQAKENLLNYVRKQVENYKLSVQDFASSFYDGSVFCALVHSMEPDLIDWNRVLEDTPKNNLETAFSAAEKLGIPRMLDVEDMVHPQLSSRPDEKCIMTYVSEFPVAYVECLKKREFKAKEQAELEKKVRDEEMQRIMNEQQSVLKKTKTTEDLLRTSVDNERKNLQEELERLRKENEKLQSDLASTKNKLIGKLTIVVKEARELMEMNRIFGKSDPFVTLKLENQQYKTTVKKKTLTPKWDQEFDFFITDRRSQVDICVWDWDKFSSDEFMGKVSLRVADLPDGYNEAQWYKLQPLKEGEKMTGEILLHLIFSYGTQ